MFAKNTGELSFARCGELLSTAVFACLHNEFVQADFPSISPDYTDSASPFYTSVYSESADLSPGRFSVSAAGYADLQGVTLFVEAPVIPGFFCSFFRELTALPSFSAAEKAENFCNTYGLRQRPEFPCREQKRKSAFKTSFSRPLFSGPERSVMRL